MFDKQIFAMYNDCMNYSVALSIMFEILRCHQTAKDLADEFEISTRTVYRYVDDLCGAGIPIISKQGRFGGFYIADYFKLKEFFLTKNEKEYLINLLNSQNNFDAKLLALKIKSLGTLN